MTEVSHVVQVWAEGQKTPEAARPERAEAPSPTLYVYYGVSGTKTNVKVDGVKQAGAPTKVVLEAGAHKITKGDATTIALIKLVPVTE